MPQDRERFDAPRTGRVLPEQVSIYVSLSGPRTEQNYHPGPEATTSHQTDAQIQLLSHSTQTHPRSSSQAPAKPKTDRRRRVVRSIPRASTKKYHHGLNDPTPRYATGQGTESDTNPTYFVGARADIGVAVGEEDDRGLAVRGRVRRHARRCAAWTHAGKWTAVGGGASERGRERERELVVQ